MDSHFLENQLFMLLNLRFYKLNEVLFKLIYGSLSGCFSAYIHLKG